MPQTIAQGNLRVLLTGTDVLISRSATLDFARLAATGDIVLLFDSDGPLNATLTHALTEDWALDAGYNYRWRDADSEGRATSDRLFLEMRREFEWQP